MIDVCRFCPPLAVGLVMGNRLPLIAVLCFALLVPVLAAWLILLVRLFSILRKSHPSVYEALGSPSLFWNN
jgi:hypothetical protein